MRQNSFGHSLMHFRSSHLFLVRLELEISQHNYGVKNSLISRVVTSLKALGLASSGSGRARLPAVVAICCGTPAGPCESRKHISSKLGMAQHLETKKQYTERRKYVLNYMQMCTYPAIYGPSHNQVFYIVKIAEI